MNGKLSYSFLVSVTSNDIDELNFAAFAILVLETHTPSGESTDTPSCNTNRQPHANYTFIKKDVFNSKRQS